MKILKTLLISAAAVVVATTAFAQSPDSKYCSTLGEMYRTYVADPGDRRPIAAPADVATAMSQCNSNPASAIPVLEHALTDKKISLPPRS
jgi:hypothetical protein